MATKIDKAKVSHVLLPDGKWQEIVEGSFDVGDVWPWQQDGDTRGAEWIEAGADQERRVFCPLTALRALAYSWDGRPKHSN